MKHYRATNHLLLIASVCDGRLASRQGLAPCRTRLRHFLDSSNQGRQASHRWVNNKC